jgi:hypothetical protein
MLSKNAMRRGNGVSSVSPWPRRPVIPKPHEYTPFDAAHVSKWFEQWMKTKEKKRITKEEISSEKQNENEKK